LFAAPTTSKLRWAAGLTENNTSVLDMEDAGLYLSAAEGGVVQNFKWLAFLSNKPYNLTECLFAAAKLERIEMLEYLGDNLDESDLCSELYRDAAERGLLKVFHWMRVTKQFKLDKSDETALYDIAASNGHLDLIKLMRSLGVEWNDDATLAAAGSDSTDMLVWLVENGCPIDLDDVVMVVVDRCNVNMLKWILDKFPKYDIANQSCWVCNSAASKGSLEMFKFALSKGCLFDKETFRQAAKSNTHEVLEFILTTKYRKVLGNLKEIVEIILKHGSNSNKTWLVKFVNTARVAACGALKA
jgi:hypothetical protein